MKRDFFHANDSCVYSMLSCCIRVSSRARSLTKPIRYVQRTRPDPPSELRRVAYMDGTPIPGEFISISVLGMVNVQAVTAFR